MLANITTQRIAERHHKTTTTTTKTLIDITRQHRTSQKTYDIRQHRATDKNADKQKKSSYLYRPKFKNRDKIFAQMRRSSYINFGNFWNRRLKSKMVT
jgi:hypothetical protein